MTLTFAMRGAIRREGSYKGNRRIVKDKKEWTQDNV